MVGLPKRAFNSLFHSVFSCFILFIKSIRLIAQKSVFFLNIAMALNLVLVLGLEEKKLERQT